MPSKIWNRLSDQLTLVGAGSTTITLEYSKIEQSGKVRTVMTCICYVPKTSNLNPDANASMQAMHTNNNTNPTIIQDFILFPSNYEDGETPLDKALSSIATSFLSLWSLWFPNPFSEPLTWMVVSTGGAGGCGCEFGDIC